jgi:hypothetical protein
MTLMRKLIAGARWLDNHWLGDLIGAVCLMIIGYSGFFIAGILQ